MAQIDKIQVQSTTYDVAQSSAASFTGTSNDTSNPTGWSNVNVLGNTETNGSIFTKISKMFANIRWLYKQLGTTDYSATGGSTVSAALSALQSGKAASSHSHTVANLPVTDQQNNSSSTIPTSALIYSMNQTLTSLNDASYRSFVFGNAIYDGTYDGNNKTSVTLNALKDASTTAIQVIFMWVPGVGNYYMTSALIDNPEYKYHIIFDLNATMHTGLAVWTKTSGNLAITMSNDIFIYRISPIKLISYI